MTTAKQTVKFTVWAVYYEGKFSSYNVLKDDLDMCSEFGWVKVRDFDLEIIWDEKGTPEAVVQNLRREIEHMRATAEMAIKEKVDILNSLLAIENFAEEV